MEKKIQCPHCESELQLALNIDDDGKKSINVTVIKVGKIFTEPKPLGKKSKTFLEQFFSDDEDDENKEEGN